MALFTVLGTELVYTAATLPSPSAPMTTSLLPELRFSVLPS